MVVRLAYENPSIIKRSGMSLDCPKSRRRFDWEIQACDTGVSVDQIGVAILAGGRSARMGVNKALLRVHAGGPTLIETVAARLREAGLEPALLVTNTPEDYTFLDIPSVPDEIPGAGPLGGILTALLHSPQPRSLIVACDMPALNPALLRYMAALSGRSDAVVPRLRNEDGSYHIEPLHSIYSRSCIEPARTRIQAGSLRVADLLREITVRWVEEEEIRLYDPQLISFRNANTPEEWDEIVTNYELFRTYN